MWKRLCRAAAAMPYCAVAKRRAADGFTAASMRPTQGRREQAISAPRGGKRQEADTEAARPARESEEVHVSTGVASPARAAVGASQ